MSKVTFFWEMSKVPFFWETSQMTFFWEMYEVTLFWETSYLTLFGNAFSRKRAVRSDPFWETPVHLKGRRNVYEIRIALETIVSIWNFHFNLLVK